MHRHLLLHVKERAESWRRVDNLLIISPKCPGLEACRFISWAAVDVKLTNQAQSSQALYVIQDFGTGAVLESFALYTYTAVIGRLLVWGGTRLPFTWPLWIWQVM